MRSAQTSSPECRFGQAGNHAGFAQFDGGKVHVPPRIAEQVANKKTNRSDGAAVRPCTIVFKDCKVYGVFGNGTDRWLNPPGLTEGERQAWFNFREDLEAGQPHRSAAVKIVPQQKRGRGRPAERQPQ